METTYLETNPPVLPKSNTTSITIRVSDINDNIPICALTVVSINIFDGQYNDSHFLFNASCMDPDLDRNGEVVYELVQSTVPPSPSFLRCCCTHMCCSTSSAKLFSQLTITLTLSHRDKSAPLRTNNLTISRDPSSTASCSGLLPFNLSPFPLVMSPLSVGGHPEPLPFIMRKLQGRSSC